MKYYSNIIILYKNSLIHESNIIHHVFIVFDLCHNPQTITVALKLYWIIEEKSVTTTNTGPLITSISRPLLTLSIQLVKWLKNDILDIDKVDR